MPAGNATGPSSKELSQALFEALIEALPDDRSADEERWRVHELIAHLVTFHRREDKPMWWQRFEWLKMNEEELAEDPDCLAGVERTKTKPWAEKKSLVYEYRFDPAQETKLREGKDWLAWHDPEEEKGSIHSFDAGAGLLTIKATSAPPERMSLVPDEEVPGLHILESSIRRIAERWQQQARLEGALGDLLHRRPPRLPKVKLDARLFPAGRDPTDAAVRVIAAMDETVLAVQGPPGAGKTHVGAAAIAQLIAAGKRVGVTAHSHKAIEHLMSAVMKAAKAAKQRVRAVKVGGDEDASLFTKHPEVTHAERIRAVDLDTKAAPQLVGGTAYAFASEVAEGRFDYLFVDEAGQYALANLVAASPSARNLVLLGDQMQLAQPLKGVHPGSSGTSALDYLLTKPDGTIYETIPPERGIFLPTTHRMHPDVCRFISEAVYEGRLEAEAHTKHRVIAAGKRQPKRIPFSSGIHFIAVPHEANVQESEEEVEMIAELIDELRGRSVQEKQDAKPRPLTDADILVVAPYNRQVNLLKATLPNTIRVGTVDLFQGQEAPVVIISMCASSADDAPRGLEFLMSQRRLNVAISRAQSLAIIVGSPELTRTRVTSVAQMKLVNLFCRAVAAMP